MIVMMPNENLKKLSPEDKAFLQGFCAATDRAASLLYNLKFVYMDNFDIDGVALPNVVFVLSGIAEGSEDGNELLCSDEETNNSGSDSYR